MRIEQNTNEFEWLQTLSTFAKGEFNIDLGKINTVAIEQRAEFLINIITTPNEIDNFANNTHVNPNENSQFCGISLIKPEMIPDKEDIKAFLTSIGCKPIELPLVHLSHEQWMTIYANRIRSYPEIVYLYFTQRAYGVVPVLFNYPSLESYNSIGLQVDDANDPAEMFNRTYCGHAYESKPRTFRGQVVRNALMKRGFINMTGFANAFDPFKYFLSQPPSKILGAFNGIHIPDSSQECIDNFATILGTDFTKQE